MTITTKSKLKNNEGRRSERVKISTRGRYAIRLMIDLAEHYDEGYIPMKVIAERQGISHKYLEQIVPVLAKNNYIDGLQGKGGGYKLSKKPEEYTIGNILRLTEGDLAPVSCLKCGALPCERKSECKTLKMWCGFLDITNKYFDAIKLSDFI